MMFLTQNNFPNRLPFLIFVAIILNSFPKLLYYIFVVILKVVFNISKSFSIFQSRFRYFKIVFDISKSFSIFQSRFRYFKIVFVISKSFPIAIEELLHCHELVCVRHNDESVLCQNIIACLVVFLVVVNCYDMIHDDGVVTVFLSFGIVVA